MCQISATNGHSDRGGYDALVAGIYFHCLIDFHYFGWKSCAAWSCGSCGEVAKRVICCYPEPIGDSIGCWLGVREFFQKPRIQARQLLVEPLYPTRR